MRTYTLEELMVDDVVDAQRQEWRRQIDALGVPVHEVVLWTDPNVEKTSYAEAVGNAITVGHCHR